MCVCVCVCVCVFDKSFWIIKLRKLYFGMFVLVLFNFFKASTPFQDNCVREIHSNKEFYIHYFILTSSLLNINLPLSGSFRIIVINTNYFALL